MNNERVLFVEIASHNEKQRHMKSSNVWADFFHKRMAYDD